MSTNKRFLIASFGFVIAVLIIVIAGQNVSTQTREGEPEDPDLENPLPTPTPTQQIESVDIYTEIDAKALTAQNGQAQAIGELVDAIFTSYGVSETPLTSTLKDRIVRAEVNNLEITEQQLTNTVDWLVDEISAPEFAKTSPLQTRALRLNSNEFMPNLFPEEAAVEKLYTTPTSMSVCEGVCLLLDIIYQKRMNPFFQKSPVEVDAEITNMVQQSVQQPTEDSATMTIEEYTETFGSVSQSEIERVAPIILDRLGIPR